MTTPVEVLVLADSHGAVFNHDLFKQHFPAVTLDVRLVHGATASGMENPNSSKTQAYPIFMQALAASRAPKVIVTLGEVDTGFVIWHRAAKYRESVDVMAERALTAYTRLLGEIAATREVLCLSTALPTIRDDNVWGEVANLRKTITATQRERTELTLWFNQRVEAWCSARGITYLALDPVSIGLDGLVRPDLLNPNPCDHHYDWTRYAELILPRLGEFLLQPALTRCA
jgi:hypothetical protein